MQTADRDIETWRSDELAARDALLEVRRRETAVHGAAEAKWRTRSRWCGVLRLVLFAIAAVLVVRAARGEPPGIGGAIAGVAAFVVLVAVHRVVLRALEQARRARILAVESALRLQGGTGPGTHAALPQEPVSDLDRGHAVYRADDRVQALSPWALDDLDVEGRAASLHTLLDTTQSELGGRRLRWLLRHPLLDSGAIGARQAAVSELADERALRDRLLRAVFACRELSQKRLPAFLSMPRLLAGGPVRFAVHLIGASSAPLLVLAFLNAGFIPGAAACLTAATVFNFALRRRALVLRNAYLELEPVARVALEVAPLLGRHAPRSAYLREQQRVFGSFAGPGAADLRRAARALRLLHLHETGFLYGVVQFLTLWDLHALFDLEAIVKRDPGRFERLIGALADLEAHAALAVYADERPGVTMPEILDDAAPRIEIEAGEHPLLPFGKAVPNDVQLGGGARLAIVTGSNMSGKSTFLRMTALDVIAAQIGAPVRARRMRAVPVALHANINVRDSLADGKSYFLVEVERVHGILQAAAGSTHVLGIFDELFRGTNSRERVAASREIARTLAASGGLFILATHDQELASLATLEAVPGTVAVHFRDEIAGGRMVFPYRLHAGVARTHNAIRLLEITGYPAALVERARRAAGFEDGPPGASEGAAEPREPQLPAE